MKNAKFMLGLGVGLILGALLLQIMNMGQGALNANLGKDEVIEAANRLGLKIVEPTEKLMTEEEWKQQSETDEQPNNKDTQKGTDATNKDANTSTSPETPKTPSAPNSSDTEAKTTTPQAPSTPTTPTTAQVDQTQKPATANSPTAKEIKFTIAKGDFLSDVSSGLEKAGVISSAKEFQKEAVAKKANYKLKIGTYSFTAGEEYSSIISKIAPGTK
ncbi:hypothetical protein [Paenibacillus turicensis]|nr:hypothetical protein [Paenibacillus turicensis]